jgi:glycerol-3-phosphate dehydrogenase (NAD(P)+)
MPARAPAIAVFGAGSWGTALAVQLARNGNRVLLWARNPQQAADIQASGRNSRFFPDFDLPEGLQATDSLDEAVAQGGPLLLAVPSHGFVELLEALLPRISDGQGLAWACKGFEPGSGRLLHQVATARVGANTPLAVVTGPSFAHEVVQDLPTAVTVAGRDTEFTELLVSYLHGGSFRAYTSTDITGAELGGAVKNVLAVATGIADGMQLGDNARAALVTRGLAEMMRLGAAMGAQPETLTGLAGMGDLVLTCTGDASRNRRLGLALGRGQSLEQAVADIGQVVEGIGAAAEVMRLAQAREVTMPISEQVNAIIHAGADPRECLRRLLARQPKAEHAD